MKDSWQIIERERSCPSNIKKNWSPNGLLLIHLKWLGLYYFGIFMTNFHVNLTINNNKWDGNDFGDLCWWMRGTLACNNTSPSHALLSAVINNIFHSSKIHDKSYKVRKLFACEHISRPSMIKRKRYTLKKTLMFYRFVAQMTWIGPLQGLYDNYSVNLTRNSDMWMQTISRIVLILVFIIWSIHSKFMTNHGER